MSTRVPALPEPRSELPAARKCGDMVEIMAKEAGAVQLRELVKKLIPESIGKEIQKQTQGIFPLKDVLIRKVNVYKLNIYKYIPQTGPWPLGFLRN